MLSKLLIDRRIITAFVSLYSKRQNRAASSMQVFTNSLNPVTGENEWNLQAEDYDYKQEIARSSYADMLHDTERNNLYFEGIKRSVALLRSQNKEIHVLDIGTGTGLLSMMALSCGVDSVTACEAFTPMAECAKDILKLNGYLDKVNLISKRSTEIECGEGKEMPRRANLLVTEVFDTELIGEGAIETYAHAKEYLLTPDALLVPSSATVYAQVVSSNLIKRWNKLEPLKDVNGKELLSIPESIENCPGAAAVHDIQLSEVSSKAFEVLSNPIPVFEFDWSGRRIPLAKKRRTCHKFVGSSSRNCDGVFMWWDLKMDPAGEVKLSCAPVWDHPLTRGKADADSSEIPWRDHWMQAVYYLPKPFFVNTMEEVTLISSHDEYSFWFDISENSASGNSTSERPVCECGLHATTSRTRIGQLNDPRRTSLFVRTLQTLINPDTVCLFLGDSCLLAIVAAKLGALHVYVQTGSPISKRILQVFIRANEVTEKITFLSSPEISKEDLVKPISLVFSEPYFDTSLLPWHSLQILYRLRSFEHLLSEEAIILPNRVDIRAVPLQFRDLWKIRTPLTTCSGFEMQHFDELIESSRDEADEPVEPQPLWEYPSTALGPPSTLLSIPLHTETLEENQEAEKHLRFECCGTLNGVGIWADWYFGDGDENLLSTGPVRSVLPGGEVSWDMHTRQGVYLLKRHQNVTTKSRSHLVAEASFNVTNGLINFTFEVEDGS